MIYENSALEAAESTLLLASGMCASTVMMLALVPAGGHMITTTDCYRKTRIFIETVLPKMGITVWIVIHVSYSNTLTVLFFVYMGMLWFQTLCVSWMLFFCLNLQATVIDPADIAGLESALDNHKVSSTKSKPTLLHPCRLTRFASQKVHYVLSMEL